MIERRQIAELVARYSLEPSLTDVFVEGRHDQAFICWIAKHNKLANIVPYDIDTVDIPIELLNEHKQRNGKQGRVITLALELEKHSSHDLYHTVACVADADVHRALTTLPSNRLLIFTDYPATELYLFNEEHLHNFFLLVLKRPDIVAADAIQALTPLLRDLFIIRLTACELEIYLAPVPFQKDCDVNGRTFSFIREDYVQRFIRRDGFAKMETVFLSRIDHWQTCLSGDYRHFAHGHDFCEALHWYLSKVLRIGGLPNVDNFERSMWGCLQPDAMADTELVRELQNRFSPPSRVIMEQT